MDATANDRETIAPRVVCETPTKPTRPSSSARGVVKETPVKHELVRVRSMHDASARGALTFATATECEEMCSREKHARCQLGVTCDPYVSGKLREHQRAGARWMYRALHGLDERERSNAGTRGVVLADEMGLGKSLQVLAVLWTMLTQGPSGEPTCRRAVLVCPASLIGNWGAEFKKWLGGVRAQASLCEGNAEAVDAACDRWCAEPRTDSKSAFDRWPVLVMSYETARRLAPRVRAMRPELMICDEAHRLRNAMGSQTMTALREIEAPMRVLLTGTPVQNNLNEYAAVLDFAQPGILGSLEDFQRDFAQPIQRQYERGASEQEIAKGRKMAEELNRRTSGKILSRKASTNAAYLPKKTEIVVLCPPTQSQRMAYESGAKLVETWTKKDNSASFGAAALCAIGILRQAANEVDQILMQANSVAEVQTDAEKELDVEVESDAIARATTTETSVDELKAVMADALPSDYGGGIDGSGKFTVLQRMLEALKDRGDCLERIVIVSGYSASLASADKICKKLDLPTSRLDGTVPVDLRTSIVKDFNNGDGGQVMLLSVVAGGAGLNLVGANRLILMDVSWNPAHDRQAMGRVWRDGQRKPVTIYRLITSGTVEQKVFERQLGKEVLKNTVESGYAGYEGDGFVTKDSLTGLVKFTGDGASSNVLWGHALDVVDCPLLRFANARGAMFSVIEVDDARANEQPASAPKRAAPKDVLAGKLARKRIAFADLFSADARRK